MSWIRTAFVQVLVLAAFLLVLDVGGFFLLPSKMERSLWPFRCTDCNSPPFVGRRAYPQGYFLADPARGFDIRPGFVTQSHWVSGVTYHIWSNTLGCFDTEHDASEDYIYIAGDSMAWGFAPHETLFGTLLEKQLGMQVTNCGVPHTGQFHQLAKARELIARIGNPPKAIIVAHHPNDVCNDLAFPHSTVIDGWLVDNRRILKMNDDWTAVERPIGELAALVESGAVAPRRNTTLKRAIFRLKVYSLSANIVSRAWSFLLRKTSILEPPAPGFYDKGPCDGMKSASYQGPVFARNKEALLAFKKYAGEINAEFAVMLIPPSQEIRDKNYFAKLHKFFSENSIRSLDLTPAIEKAVREFVQIYYANDPHFTVHGNKAVADELAPFVKSLLNMEDD